MAIYGNTYVWPNMVIDGGDVWQYMATNGNTWQYIVIYANIWQYMAIQGGLWQYAAILMYGKLW